MKRLLVFFILFFWLKFLPAQTISADLRSSWQFRKSGDTKWYKAEVPGTVHTDLLTNKLIPDPFYRDNEEKVQWVEKENWEYRTSFAVDAKLFSKKNIELVFDGLDTYAKVWLNGKLILTADNMFRQWRVSVKTRLKSQGNELRIIFYSAVKRVDSLAALSAIKLAGEHNRMYSRKAQYQYGWDWGPRFVTCGIWKNIHWEGWDDIKPVTFKAAKKWDVELVTRPDSIGQTFYFTVNGNPTFIKGANWIPCESFLPRAKKLDLYRKLLSAAKEANINMLRVWGGGVYEDDLFYDLCDQYGIMVWQDFMFAGALYPGDDHFLKNVEEEVRYQVQRLRSHPCIVLWCGNNEIDEAWHNWGWQQRYRYKVKDSIKLWNDYKKIFHQLIPGILKELDPLRAYWPSSPSLGWGREQAYKQGDVHYWGVWWGEEPVEKYNEKVGRFVSEYGMQGFPNIQTIRKFTIPTDLDTLSAVMKTHQKHPFGYHNINLYIRNIFRTPKSFEDFVYVSQLMQADAIRTAIEAHRRNRPVTMGTMFWQWNDCWPVVSWSAIDYYANKKALYYEVKRSFAPYAVSIVSGSNSGKHFFLTDTVSSFTISVEKSFFDFSGKEFQDVRKEIQNLTVKEGTPLDLDRPGSLLLWPNQGENYYRLFTVKRKDSIICQAIEFNRPPKELNLPKTTIQWKMLSGNRLELISDKFAYGVFVDLPEGVEMDDNYFHLLPGEKKIVQLSGRIDINSINQKIKIKSLVDTY